jgi:hypothetical protein
MPSVATRRLIEASAALDPAERALLNLWVNRGLDDNRLARLGGLTPEGLVTRRERIVDRLAGELGLPEPAVRDALDELAAGSRADGSEEPAAESDEPPAAEPPAPPPPPPPSARPGERGLALPAAGVLLLVTAGVVFGVTRGGGHSVGHSRPRARPPAAAAAAAPAAVTTGLSPLPGGPTGATGAVSLTSSRHILNLRLTVSQLPPALPGGRYVAWLYNSVLDSEALGPLTGTTARFTLPADAARFTWIDVSLQPAGDANHSGDSQLRAPNPAHR